MNTNNQQIPTTGEVNPQVHGQAQPVANSQVQQVVPGAAVSSQPQAQAASPQGTTPPQAPPSIPTQNLSDYFSGNKSPNKNNTQAAVASPPQGGGMPPQAQASAATAIPEVKEKKGKSSVTSFLYFILELAVTVVLAFVVVFAVKKYVIQPFFVEGVSMESSFHDGEYLIINELSYRWNDPERADVIVFKYPLNESKFYIKRIVGLPGETVKIEEGTVEICETEETNCEVLDESAYLDEGLETNNDIVLELKDNEYFVLGDNRDQSSDSRFWGALEEDYIIGKVWVKAYPFGEFEVYK